MGLRVLVTPIALRPGDGDAPKSCGAGPTLPAAGGRVRPAVQSSGQLEARQSSDFPFKSSRLPQPYGLPTLRDPPERALAGVTGVRSNGTSSAIPRSPVQRNNPLRYAAGCAGQDDQIALTCLSNPPGFAAADSWEGFLIARALSAAPT